MVHLTDWAKVRTRLQVMSDGMRHWPGSAMITMRSMYGVGVVAEVRPIAMVPTVMTRVIMHWSMGEGAVMVVVTMGVAKVKEAAVAMVCHVGWIFRCAIVSLDFLVSAFLNVMVLENSFSANGSFFS